jgi:uncharacterized protein (DUF1501 family)
MEQGISLAGTGFSVHPSCKDLADLFASRELLFCPSAGTTDASRSHFQAQDLFEIGSGAAKGESGFMARLATMLGAERPSNGAISFTREIPLAFQGADNPPDVAPLSGSGLKLPAGKVLDAIRKAHAGLKTGEAIDQAISTQGEIDAAIDREGAARGALSANGFPKIAAHLGRILKANSRLAVSFVDLGGFDTHAGEEATLSRALQNLSGGLSALKESLGTDEWGRTRVVVMSEFGRTVRENGTKGTDHGHGGLFLLASGSIGGGRMARGISRDSPKQRSMTEGICLLSPIGGFCCRRPSVPRLEYPIDLWTSSFPESRAKKLGYEFQKNYGCILVFFAFSRYKYL